MECYMEKGSSLGAMEIFILVVLRIMNVLVKVKWFIRL